MGNKENKEDVGAKQKICDALCRLAEKQPVSDIRIKELVAEAGISRNAYYYHFGSVDEVIEYMMDEFLELIRRYYRNIRKNKTTSYSDDLRVFYESVLNKKEHFLTLINSEYHLLFNDKMISAFCDGLRDLRYVGDDGREIFTEREEVYYRWSMSYFCVAVLETWALSRFKESPEEMAEIVKKIQSAQFGVLFKEAELRN